MRLLIKVLLVLAASAAVTGFVGRLVTGRTPGPAAIAAGTVLLTAAVLALDLWIGW
jgi:hypothetical protein